MAKIGNDIWFCKKCNSEDIKICKRIGGQGIDSFCCGTCGTWLSKRSEKK